MAAAGKKAQAPTPVETASRHEVPLQAQKMEVLGRLAGAVIHDLNNLLTVIHLNAGFIESGDLTWAEAIGASKKIEEASRRAAELTRKVLNFSRGLADKTGEVNLHDLVTGLTRLLEPLVAKRVRIDIMPGPRDLWVRGNHSAIEQAIMNLVLNAVDAMPDGGLVTITFAERTGTPGGPGSMAGILVSDEGAGIAPEDRDKVFEPFFTTRDTGTGMGLAIVHRIAQRHGGSVDFESEPGQGTRFRLWLPMTQSPSAAVESGHPAHEVILQGLTVLVVEDDTGILALSSRLLEAMGLRVIRAATGEDALRKWGMHRDGVDLLFTDIVLPGTLSGRDLALKILEEKPALPVLYTSGYSGVGEDQSYFTVNNFLPKPFPAQSLERAITRLLART